MRPVIGRHRDADLTAPDRHQRTDHSSHPSSQTHSIISPGAGRIPAPRDPHVRSRRARQFRLEGPVQGAGAASAHGSARRAAPPRETARFPVIIVFAGVDGAGKSETVNLLNEWMDPRWIVTTAFGEPSDEEAERPRVLALLARASATRPRRPLPQLLVFAAAARAGLPPHQARRVRRCARAGSRSSSRRLPTTAR